MLQRIRQAFWGDLSAEEFKRFGILSMTLLSIIGSYWLMRPLKDGLFMAIVGYDYIPYAKIASVCIMIPLVLIYSGLVDRIPKQRLFYVICTFYGLLFILYGFILLHPTIGLGNPVPSPDRLMGWILYLSIESFGTLTVALFWSFVASNTSTAVAKRGYALIISGAQIGAVTGPLIATRAETLGMTLLCWIVASGILVVPFLIRFFVTLYPGTAETSVSTKKKTGAFEGLRLLLVNPYLFGVLGVATLYEIIGTIIDFQMKVMAKAHYGQTEAVTAFLGWFGVAANGLALVFAFTGTSFFIRRFGLTFCLVAFPTLISGVLGYVWFFPALWTFFGAMVTIKGLSYALNNPCKEMMYIPTSKDVKFKAKGWIDMFGNRCAKGTGSAINAGLGSLANLMYFGPLISLCVAAVWASAALYVGRSNKKLVEEGRIIE